MVDSSKKVWRFNYSLLLRIMSGLHNDEAKSLLQDLEIPCDLVDRSGKTLLHYALKYRNSEMLQHLIEMGHNVEIQDSNGFTPLTLAANNDDVSALGVLIKYNADIYCIQRNGMSFLQVAVNKRIVKSEETCLKQTSHSIFDIFIDRVNRDFLNNDRKITSQLFDADNLVKLAIVAYGNVEFAEFILKNNYAINYVVPEKRLSALHWAIIFGKFDNAKLLIRHGAAVGLLRGTINWPLYYYTDNFERIDEQSEVLKILLKIQCVRERDLLQLLSRGTKKTVRVLLESYIDVVSMKFEDKASLLHILMRNKNFDDFDFFAKLIAIIDLNLPSDCGTPLMDAVRCRCPKKVEFLLRHGANVNWAVGRGFNTAVFSACTPYFLGEVDVKKTLVKIVELLLQYGADVQIVLYGERTIFDVIKCSHKTELLAETIIAHLALLETLHRAFLIDRIRNQIKADPILENHFDSCVRDIEELKGIQVYGTITLWNLLTEKVEKLAPYARNQQFLLAFDCLMKKITHIQSYYLNTLQKKVAQALDVLELKRKAAAIIEILIGLCSDVYHVIIYKIIRYLNLQDLKNLCKVENIILDV